VSLCIEDCALIPAASETELLVGFNESQHGIVIWRRRVAVDVHLHALLRGLATLIEFPHQLVANQLLGRRLLDQLQQDLSRVTRLFNPASKLVRRR
jgi:hypothetical protein